MNAQQKAQLAQLLEQLLGCREPDHITSLLVQLDRFLSEVREQDAMLAHYLERRSYAKALAYLRGEPHAHQQHRT